MRRNCCQICGVRLSEKNSTAGTAKRPQLHCRSCKTDIALISRYRAMSEEELHRTEASYRRRLRLLSLSTSKLSIPNLLKVYHMED